MALSDINEVVDRSIEDRLYLTALIEGYTPNRVTYATDPIGYQAALDAIITANGFAVDIYGAGSDDNRDLLKSPRIVYDNIAFQPGGLGGGNELFYVDNGGDYTSFRRQPRTGQLRFSVTLISKNAKQDRVLHGILARALKSQSYVAFYNDPLTEFLITYVYNRTEPDLKEGLIKKVYLYEAHDLFEDDHTEIQTSVAKITDIQVSEDQSTVQKATDTEIVRVVTP